MFDETFEAYLMDFEQIVSIGRDTENYKYMYALYQEAQNQMQRKPSENGIPLLLREENFPSLHAYGDDHDQQKATDTLIGWLFAMHLASLRPKDRTALCKLGYELGGYDRYDNIYCYAFDTDPNNMRLLAGVIYAAMRGVLMPDDDVLREEIGGTKYDKTLRDLGGDTRTNVGPDDFFTDFRESIPTAPGPYAPGYTSRPDNTYPTEPRDAYGNLQVDRDVHESNVIAYNLNNEYFRQAVVQAIADKEADKHHLFGKNRKTEHYEFHPVFGTDTIGIELADDDELAEFASVCFSAMSSARGILQAANISPVEYGRLRPGCSWSQEALKNSASDDRRNVLVNIEVEDNDGCKDTPNTYGHYDKEGYWVYTQTEADQYAEQQKNNLYANSYPSGHSAGIMGVALLLIELFPTMADVILRAAIRYSLNRSIARYHWLSDIINGRVLGVWQSAVARAAADFNATVKRIRSVVNPRA